MLQIIRVTGYSLSPEYQEGDFVLVLKIPFLLRELQKGDIVVFHHPIYGVMIKRVDGFTPHGEELLVVGDHPDSTDSRKIGPIKKEALMGRVLWHLRRPRRSGAGS